MGFRINPFFYFLANPIILEVTKGTTKINDRSIRPKRGISFNTRDALVYQKISSLDFLRHMLFLACTMNLQTEHSVVMYNNAVHDAFNM